MHKIAMLTDKNLAETIAKSIENHFFRVECEVDHKERYSTILAQFNNGAGHMIDEIKGYAAGYMACHSKT